MGEARTFGVGMDYSPTSKASLRWAAENLVEEGDRIILIHVQPPQADHSRKQLFEDTGSRMCFSRSYTTISCPDNSRSCTLLLLFLLSMKLIYVFVSALVPLEEFREINYSKQYGLTHDPEVHEILDTVSKTKGVCLHDLFSS